MCLCLLHTSVTDIPPQFHSVTCTVQFLDLSPFSHLSLFSFPRRVKLLGIVLSKSPPLHHNSVWSVDFYIMVFCEVVLIVLCPYLAYVTESWQEADSSCEDFQSFRVSTSPTNAYGRVYIHSAKVTVGWPPFCR